MVDLRKKEKHIIELENNIKETHKAALESGQTVEAIENMSFVTVYRGIDDEYTFQGDEAEQLFKEFKKHELNVNFEQWLLWTSQSW